MKRTQISLEPWELEALQTEAEREGRSMSSVVREAVGVYLALKHKEAPTRLAEIRGIASAGGVSAADHDRYIYDDEAD